MSKNLSELSGRKGLAGNLFEELGIAARQTGTPSLDDMERLTEEFLVGKANVYGSVSFYDFLKTENRGKKVYLCNGSACLTARTQQSLEARLANHFTASEIGTMCCLGRCHENSAFYYEGKNYSGDAVTQIGEIKHTKSAISDHYHVDRKSVV